MGADRRSHRLHETNRSTIRYVSCFCFSCPYDPAIARCSMRSREAKCPVDKHELKGVYSLSMLLEELLVVFDRVKSPCRPQFRQESDPSRMPFVVSSTYCCYDVGCWPLRSPRSRALRCCTSDFYRRPQQLIIHVTFAV